MGKVTDNCNSMFLMGQRLKECRDIRGLSQDQLAEAVEKLSDNRGKTRSAKHISYLENGARAMSVEYANLLAQALNIRPEYLLLKDDFKTESERIHALTFGEHEVYDLIIEVMKLHGYEIVAETFDYEPPEIDEKGNEYRRVHYGIKSQENAACAYIGHDEINRLLKEVDDFIEFKCLTSVRLITDRFERKNRIARNWKEGNRNG